jgi:hypothetical protein
MSDSPKGPREYLALQLIPVVPDGTPRAPAQDQTPRDPHASLWFDDPETRYLLH